jgi:hypothetical protein
MSVTLSEVKRAARAHRAPLAGESAGYLILALADQVLSAPRLIDASDVQLTDDGGLRVLRGEASSETDAELSLRRALDSLLLVASSGSAALMRAGRRAAPVGLSGLVRELEAALIPVNRGAARRALARLHRETERAVENGSLAAEEPEIQVEAPVGAARHSEYEALVALPDVHEHEPAVDTDDSKTRPIAARTPELVQLPPVLSDPNGVMRPLCGESNAPLDESPLSDALTIALDVCSVAETVLLDEDVEFLDQEPSEALTLARNIEVRPIAESAMAELALVELPEEACTKPEPIILRQALRPLAQPQLALEDADPPPRTPTLGSLAAELPVLAPELIAQLTRREADARTLAAEPSAPAEETADWVVCSAPLDECTEPMPEVALLSHGVAIVVSRKSDVTELLADFQVAADETQQGFCRAIKEMAELDLTPAPFAALIR